MANESARPQGISVVVTVLDDRAALEDLLGALASQRRPADEIVVVDGGSTDGTLDLLGEAADRLPIRTIEAAGANISAGRNAGVASARFEWVACTDAGCRPAAGWLAAIEAASREADFVAGVYAVDARTPFERALADALYPAVEEARTSSPLVRAWQAVFGKRFVPEEATGRSMAFRRGTWEAAGGFPEHLYAGEDVAFSRAVARTGMRLVLATDALVHWRPRSTWRANAAMYAVYARGDVRGGLGRHLARGAAWLGGAALARRRGAGRALAAGGAGIYLSLPLVRAVRARHGPRVWALLPLVIAMKDLAQLWGAAAGATDALRGADQRRPARLTGRDGADPAA